jgi:hypothetical protein
MDDVRSQPIVRLGVQVQTKRPSAAAGLDASRGEVACAEYAALPEPAAHDSAHWAFSAEAVRRVLVEGARAQADLLGRQEIARRQHAHELRLAGFQQSRVERRAKGTLVAGATVVLLLVVAVGVFVGDARRARDLAEQRAAMLLLERQNRAHAMTLLQKAESRERALLVKLRQRVRGLAARR